MSFGDHLEELRRRLIFALLAPLPLMFLLLFFSQELVNLLINPLFDALELAGVPPQLQVIAPPEMLMTQLKLSVITGLGLSFPWIVFQIWLFIKPGLYRHEQRFVYFLLPFSAVLTVTALAMVYWIVLPIVLFVLAQFGMGISVPPPVQTTDESVLKALESNPPLMFYHQDPPDPAPGTIWVKWPEMELHVAIARDGTVVDVPLKRPPMRTIAQVYRVSSYVNFALLLFLGMGLAFHMPLVILLLGWVGLIDAPMLRSKRRITILILAFGSAILTPPDPFSMLLMLIPLYGLFELGIALLQFVPARKISQGTVFSLRRSDKAVSRSSQTDYPAQSASEETTLSPAQKSTSTQPDDPEAGR